MNNAQGAVGGTVGKSRTNRNIVLSVGASLVAKLMVLLQSTTISAVFGASDQVDILFYLTGLIVVITTFCSAVNQLVIVADIISVRENGTEKEYHSLVRFIFTIYLAIAAVISLALFAFPQQFLSITTAFSVEIILENITMIRIISIVLFLAVINTYIMDVFTSRRVFILPMVNDVVKSVLIIAFILFLGNRVGIETIAYGMLLAYIIQFITINVSFTKVAGFSIRPGLGRVGKASQKNAASVLIAQGASSLESMSMMWVISSFPSGFYVSVSLARKIFTVVMNMVIQQFAVVVGIDLIQYNASNQEEKLAKVFTGYLKIACYIILPVMAIFMVNAEGIVSILFGYGKFPQENVDLAGSFLRIFSLSLITFLWDVFLQRLVVAKKLNHKTFYFQIAQSVLRIALYLLLLRLFGYHGVAYGLVIGNLAFCIALGIYLFRGEYKFIKLKDTFLYMGINVLFAGLSCAVGLLCRQLYVPGMSFLGNFIYLALSSLAILAVYVLVGLVYPPNRENLKMFTGMITRVIGRNKGKKQSEVIHSE